MAMSDITARDDADLKILNLLREVVPWQLAKKEILPDMSLQTDLGVDSMGKAALVFGLEEEFGISFGQESIDVGKVLTVSDVLDITKGLIRRAARENSATPKPGLDLT